MKFYVRLITHHSQFKIQDHVIRCFITYAVGVWLR